MAKKYFLPPSLSCLNGLRMSALFVIFSVFLLSHHCSAFLLTWYTHRSYSHFPSIYQLASFHIFAVISVSLLCPFEYDPFFGVIFPVAGHFPFLFKYLGYRGLCVDNEALSRTNCSSICIPALRSLSMSFLVIFPIPYSRATSQSSNISCS